MKIALAQIENNLNIDQNVEVIKEILLSLPQDVELLVLPEGALTGYYSHKNMTIIDESDHRLKELSKLAIAHDLSIFIGAIYRKNLQIYNAYLKIDKTIQCYFKTHLGKKEEAYFVPGDVLNHFELKGSKIAAAICIESHIPDIIQTHRLAGCKIILMPFASPKRAGDRKQLWEKYLNCRAYDNNTFILATNLTGTLNNLEFSGGMLALDPKGEVIKAYYKSDRHTMIVDLDIDAATALHGDHKCNYIKKRRPSLYRKGTHELY